MGTHRLQGVSENHQQAEEHCRTPLHFVAPERRASVSRIDGRRRTPPCGHSGLLLPLEEPYSETLLGNEGDGDDDDDDVDHDGYPRRNSAAGPGLRGLSWRCSGPTYGFDMEGALGQRAHLRYSW